MVQHGRGTGGVNGAEPLPDRYYPLDELVVIDPELRRHLLEGLLGTDWVDRDVARKIWINSELRSPAGFPATG